MCEDVGEMEMEKVSEMGDDDLLELRDSSEKVLDCVVSCLRMLRTMARNTRGCGLDSLGVKYSNALRSP